MFGDDLRSLVRICGYRYLWFWLGCWLVTVGCGFDITYCCLFVVALGLKCIVPSGALFCGLFVWSVCWVWCWA